MLTESIPKARLADDDRGPHGDVMAQMPRAVLGVDHRVPLTIEDAIGSLVDVDVCAKEALARFRERASQ